MPRKVPGQNVQVINSGAQTFSSGLFPSMVTPGNTVLVYVGCYAGVSVSTVTDDLGNTYTMVAGSQVTAGGATGYTIQLFVGRIVNGGTTKITVSLSGVPAAGNGGYLYGVEFVGLAEVDGVITNTHSGSASFTVGTITPKKDGELFTGGLMISGSGTTPAAPSGWTTEGSDGFTVFADVIRSAAAPETVTFTANTNPSAAFVVSFVPSDTVGRVLQHQVTIG